MRPVHTFVEMVQCPLCRRTFMPVGDACCWRCAPPAPAPSAVELENERRARQLAEQESGSLGSLAGLGFAPSGNRDRVFGPPSGKTK